jgi:transcriptional regulator with XRE-family HTH domain
MTNSEGAPTAAHAQGQETEVDVGTRLRVLRNRRRMTLRAVAEAAGISESFLSQVERGRTNISLPALQRVSTALGVGIGDLFDDAFGQPFLLRKAERPTLELEAFGTKYLLTPRPFENLEAFIGELPPGGSTGEEPFTHGDSEELVLVISGTLTAFVGAQEYVLESGDSLRYTSATPHRAVNTGTETAQVLWVISPPSL